MEMTRKPATADGDHVAAAAPHVDAAPVPHHTPDFADAHPAHVAPGVAPDHAALLPWMDDFVQTAHASGASATLGAAAPGSSTAASVAAPTSVPWMDDFVHTAHAAGASASLVAPGHAPAPALSQHAASTNAASHHGDAAHADPKEQLADAKANMYSTLLVMNRGSVSDPKARWQFLSTRSRGGLRSSQQRRGVAIA